MRFAPTATALLGAGARCRQLDGLLGGTWPVGVLAPGLRIPRVVLRWRADVDERVDAAASFGIRAATVAKTASVAINPAAPRPLPLAMPFPSANSKVWPGLLWE